MACLRIDARGDTDLPELVCDASQSLPSEVLMLLVRAGTLLLLVRAGTHD
jgi:hypothetical protein